MTVAVEQAKGAAEFFILVLSGTCQRSSAENFLPCSSGGFALPKNLDFFFQYYICMLIICWVITLPLISEVMVPFVTKEKSDTAGCSVPRRAILAEWGDAVVVWAAQEIPIHWWCLSQVSAPPFASLPFHFGRIPRIQLFHSRKQQRTLLSTVSCENMEL